MFQKVMALLEAAERSHSMMADTHAPQMGGCHTPKWVAATPPFGGMHGTYILDY